MAALVRASCVALDGRGVLLRGASGSGKSSVALQMIGMGATLVADDQVLVDVLDGQLVAHAPKTLTGLIEVRGIGIARLSHTPFAALCLVVDLDTEQPERLPDPATVMIADQPLPLIAGANRPYLASELIAFLRAGRDPLLVDPDAGVPQADEH